MESKSCMNVACATSTSIRWRKGWALRSGAFARLCDNCGSAYEQSKFCDVFHANESGWRQCTLCGMRLHCGCIASQSLLELQDTCGISCINCTRNSGIDPISITEKPDGSGTSKAKNVSELRCMSLVNQLKVSGMQVGCAENDGLRCWLKPRDVDSNGSSMEMKQDGILPSIGELGSTLISEFHWDSSGSSKLTKAGNYDMEVRETYELLAQKNLSMTLGASLGNPNPFCSAVVDEREQSKTSPILPGPKSHHILPKHPKSTLAAGLEANACMTSPIHVARTAAEGRGRNQLLPRYWPRITYQELQQISGDSNSTIMPLFEKMLSASDAGRIGRLVLPKACAEAYFPPISQPEGIPLRIQDVKGKKWVFQFRFWPNNNSRMYVLEGVTPCIQSMQLQAGDTVTFSRMEPEGKLIMGFRKAPTSSAQSLKGSSETHLNALSKNCNSAGGDMSLHDFTVPKGRKREGLLLPSMLLPEKKRTRNIGSKSKRLLIDSQDTLELKLTWEEAQDLLRPSPTVKPSFLMIEDHVFEEYEEPPVFGKSSIFAVRSNGINEQWTKCDNCSKWRKLPVDILLPSKWTCVENLWDRSRCSCSAPNELTPRELDNLLKMNKEFNKQRMAASHEPILEHESSGLDALANAAILGDDSGDSGRTPIAATTKHPRHRPGCSCIVCIQPPSGKGRHKPTCTCNVCMTVKRRFKTLMMRKKKRQSEREEDVAQRNQQLGVIQDGSEVDRTSQILTPVNDSENEAMVPTEMDSKIQARVAEASSAKGQLDLNCQPDREGIQAESNNASTISLLQEANLTLKTYMKQNGFNSLISDQLANSASNVQAQTTNKSEERNNEYCCTASAVQDQESSPEESSGHDKSQNNPPS